MITKTIQVLGYCRRLTTRDGAVHKILVRKLHRTAQFYLHTTLHRKKFVNLIHRTANPTASQNIMVNSIA